MRQQEMAPDSQARFFHQPHQVLGCLAAEAHEILSAIQVIAQPSTQWIGPRLTMEKPPTFSCLGVVGIVEIGKQVICGLVVFQFGIPGVECRRVPVGFLVDKMDNAVANGHGDLRSD
ncbi:hypothetical protein D3C78_1657050 [compost metagenome]